MEGYRFKDVDISIFGIQSINWSHIVDPAKIPNEKFKFLIDSPSYNNVTNRLTTDNFLFDPFPGRYRRKNKFWHYYIGEINGTDIDSWSLMLPIVATYKREDKLSIKVCDEVEIKPKIQFYLSPLGIVTKMWFRLRMKNYIRNKHLVKIMAILTEKESWPYFITHMREESLYLEDVLNQYRELLLKEIYLDKYNSFYFDDDQFLKYFFVFVNHFEGKPVAYNEMVPADQALMLSILNGREYNALNVIKEINSNFLRTYLRDVITPSTNFALTDFDHGTLIFPQREAAITENTRKTVALNNNIREFLIMTLTLLNFYNCFDNYVSKGKGKIKELRNLALMNLCRIKKSYKNQFCQHFFSQHKILRKDVDKCDFCNLSLSCKFSPDN